MRAEPRETDGFIVIVYPTNKVVTRKKYGGLRGFTLLLGIFFCNFRLLQQEWIQLGGLIGKAIPKYAHANECAVF